MASLVVRVEIFDVFFAASNGLVIGVLFRANKSASSHAGYYARARG
jgi:hypothetical protein